MLDDAAFAKLLDRVRARDEAAAAELVRLYEPELRRVVRVRLGGATRRVHDSVDVCQSVFANFFVRVTAGQFDVASQDQLLKLLVTMACNRVTDKHRQQHAARRMDRHLRPLDQADLERLPGPAATPADQAAVRDLYEQVLGQLSPEERYLADQRALGRDWPELAAELGETAGALRKRLSRGLNRATRRLGLDDVDDA